MLKRPVVLVVEDDAEMNRLERQLLELNGLDSAAAFTGTEAVRMFEAAGADAVLLDLMLPEMDGYETCRRIRARSGRGLPIIMVTALDNEESRQRGAQAGSDAYFGKPFDPDAVVHALHTLLKRNTSPPEKKNGNGQP